jgi:transposase-like protein
MKHHLTVSSLLIGLFFFHVPQSAVSQGTDPWVKVIGNGFGSANNIGISEFVEFNGFLYAGTTYPGGITQLWRSSSGDAGTWSKITNYTPSLVGVTIIPSFATTTLGGGYIWLGAGGPPGAAVIYRSRNGTDWTLISKKGFGTLTNVVPAPHMVLFKGPSDTTEYLYAGAGSHGFTRPPTAGQIWRTAFNNSDSTQWTKLIDFATIDTTVKTITYFYVWNNKIYFATDGRGQLWESTDGIRFTKNSSSPSFIACIVDFQGYLYVTTNNNTTGGQLWRTSDGVNWQTITNNAFGKGSSVVELHSMHTSFGKIWITGYTDPTTAVLSPIWRSDDGINFVQSNADGFGDANNKGANPVTIGYGGSQYFGGPNSVTGAQIWRLGPPLTPTLLLPSDNSTGVPTTPTLSWNASSGAATYRLQLSTTSAFTSTVLDDSTLTSTSKQVGPLANNTTYFWRVSAKNSVGTSPFSAARSFTTIVAAPTAPTLVSPADGATGVPTNPTLSWNASAGATTYRLQLSTDSTFASTVFDDSTLTGTSKQVGPLASNTRYFWRVSAKNAGGISPFSAARRFTTAAPSSVERVGSEVPAAFELNQNYPNPFNPTTTIRYGLPARSVVRLVIYNLLGQVVSELVNGEKDMGYHEVHWQAQSSSGMYFYRLETTQIDDPSKRFVEVRKMVLLR